jgi:hypothetical protein
LDSALFPLIDNSHYLKEDLLQSIISIPSTSGKKYKLEIRLRDENKDLNVVHDLILDKTENGNDQYFLAKSNDRIIFNNISKKNSLITVEKSPLLIENKFLIESDDLASNTATPPFVLTKFNDKRFGSEYSDTIRFKNNSIEFLIDTKKTRLVPTTKDSKNQSLYMYYHYEGFPEITKIDQMLDPLRYISTTNEYNSIMESKDKQKAFEDFWLHLARDEKAARGMIREYYNRVEVSNANFSSFKEGWKQIEELFT